MIKHSDVEFNYQDLRFDTTWKFEWDVGQDNGVKFYPITKDVSGSGPVEDWWTLCASGGGTPDPNTWDPDNPFLQYSGGDWNTQHPENPMRYLGPTIVPGETSGSFVKLRSSFETVVMDTKPPELVSDAGTEYILINDGSVSARHCEFVFRDDCGLDYKNFTITRGEETLYDYKRKDPSTAVNELQNLRVFSNGADTYKVEFDIPDSFDSPTCSGKTLSLTVYDKATNSSGFNSQEFKYVDIKQDELLPLEITFDASNPPNMTLDAGIEGEVYCTIFNPNKGLWVLGADSIIEQLSADSVGWIDPSTISDKVDNSCYEENGLIRFKITNINSAGSVIVQAWVKIGSAQLDDYVKNATYAEAELGPWIVMDPDGRRYNLKQFVPKYLRQTDYYDFIKFFELFLNTMYTNVTRGTNISGLEKIAEIADFLDIDKIENYLVADYAKHRGMEWNVDLETLVKMNSGFFNPDAFTNYSETEVMNMVKYALKNLPLYNQLKGTEKGITLALKMFSFSAKLIPLWVKMDNPIEENPTFIEEDTLRDFTNMFMTSRFNVKITSKADFETFNENIEGLIRLIRSIKPITKILNLIKYNTVPDEDSVTTVKISSGYKENSETANEYTITYNYDDNLKMQRKSVFDETTRHMTKLWINFYASGENYYTVLANLGIKCKSEITLNGDIKIDCSKVKFELLDSGMYLIPTDGKTKTDLFNALFKASLNTISFTHVPGTSIYSE